MDAGGDPPGISSQRVTDGVDVLQLALDLVRDEVAHPDGQVLPAHFQGQGTRMTGDHPLVVQQECRGPDSAADHLDGARVVVTVVRHPASERDDQGDPLFAAAGAPGALGVVTGPGRHVPQDHREQLPEVDP